MEKPEWVLKYEKDSKRKILLFCQFCFTDYSSYFRLKTHLLTKHTLCEPNIDIVQRTHTFQHNQKTKRSIKYLCTHPECMVIVDRQHRHCVKEKSDHRDYLMSFSKVQELPHCILKHVVISDDEQAPSQVDQARLNWERNTYNFEETIEGFKTYRIRLL